MTVPPEVAGLTDELAKSQYEHVLKMCEVFWDWRHKVMTFSFTVTSGLLALAAWMYEHNLKGAVSIPVLLAALLLYASSVFDRRNQAILANSLRLGDLLEQRMGYSAHEGLLGSVPVRQGRMKALRTYHGVLQVSYLLLAVLLLAGGIFVALKQPSPPNEKAPVVSAVRK